MANDTDITVMEQRLEYILDTYPEVAEQYMSGDDLEFCARLEDLCANSNFDIKTFSVESLYSSGAVSGTSWDKIKPKTSNTEPPDNIFGSTDESPAQGTITDDEEIIDLFGSDDDILTSPAENSLDCQDNSALFNDDVENSVENSGAGVAVVENSIENVEDSVGSVKNSADSVENSVESVENRGMSAGQSVENSVESVENSEQGIENSLDGMDNSLTQGTTDQDDLSAMLSAAFSDVEMHKSSEELPTQRESDIVAVHSGGTTLGYTAPTFNDLDDLLCNTFYTLPSSAEASAPDELMHTDTPDDMEQDDEPTEWGINEIAPDVIFEVNSQLGAANTEFLDTKLHEFIAADITLVPDLESMCFDPGLQNYFNSYLASLDDDLVGLCEDLNDLQNLIDLDNAGLMSSQEHTIFTKWGTPYAKMDVPESQRANLPKIEDRTIIDYSQPANTNIIAPPVLDDNVSHADTPSADLSALFPGYNLDARNQGIIDDTDDASDLFEDNDELDELENREYDISAIVHEQGIISAPPSSLDDDFDEVEDDDSVEDTSSTDDDIFDDVEDADAPDEDDLFDDRDEISDDSDEISDDSDDIFAESEADSDLVTDDDLFDDVLDDSGITEDEDDSDLFDDEDSLDQSEGITIPSIQVDFDACPYPEDSPEFAKWVTAEYNKRVAEIAAQVKSKYSVDMSDYSAEDADFDDEDTLDSVETGITNNLDDEFDDEDSLIPDEDDSSDILDEFDSDEDDVFDESVSNASGIMNSEDDEFDELDDSVSNFEDTDSADIDEFDDIVDSNSDDTDEFDDIADSSSGDNEGTTDEFDDFDDSDLFSSYYGGRSSGDMTSSSSDDEFDDVTDDLDVLSSDSDDDFDELPDEDEEISSGDLDNDFDEVKDSIEDVEDSDSDDEFDDLEDSDESLDTEFDDINESDEPEDVEGSDSDDEFDDVSEEGTIDDPLDSFYGTSGDDFDDPEEPDDEMASTWDDEIADNFDDVPDDDLELGNSYNRESEDDLDDLYDSVDSFLDSQPDDSSFSTNPVNASDRGVPTSAIKKVPVTVEEKNEAAADAILSMFNKLKASPSAAKSVLDNIFSKEDN